VNRVGRFWRQRSRRGQTLLVVGAAVGALAVIVAVIGPAGDETTVTPTTTSGSEVLAGQAITCLESVGLSNVEESEVDTWRGFHEASPYAITVHKLPKPAKAPKVVAGTYAVTGRFKVAAEGEGLTMDEGLWADSLVQEVAACLGD
jgi:protein-L-isoaspartate O-methyltransferase